MLIAREVAMACRVGVQVNAPIWLLTSMFAVFLNLTSNLQLLMWYSRLQLLLEVVISFVEKHGWLQQDQTGALHTKLGNVLISSLI